MAVLIQAHNNLAAAVFKCAGDLCLSVVFRPNPAQEQPIMTDLEKLHRMMYIIMRNVY
jgi:hypothetical protein